MFQFVPRIGNVAKAIIKNSTFESVVASRFASSKKKRRDDCLDDKQQTQKDDKKEVKTEEACVDLKFKKKQINIYDYDDCLPPRPPFHKDCSTFKPKKAACNTKKRNIPTGCRKYSIYTDVQRNWSQGNRYRAALDKIQIVDFFPQEMCMQGVSKNTDPAEDYVIHNNSESEVRKKKVNIQIVDYFPQEMKECSKCIDPLRELPNPDSQKKKKKKLDKMTGISQSTDASRKL